MAKNNELRGLIYTKYSSLSDCARALGWPRQRLDRITNGYHIPNLVETAMLARVLDSSVNTIAEFFLTCRSTNA